MATIKLRTEKASRFGKTLNTDVGMVSVDAKGYAEVDEDSAAELTKVGFEVLDSKKLADIKSAEAEKIKAINAEKTLAAENELKRLKAENEKADKDAADAKAKADATPDVIAPIKGVEKEEEKKEEEKKETDGNVDLSKKTIRELREVCEGMEYPKKEWEDLKKDELVSYVESKLEA